jgi:DNA repair photolyase
MVTRGIPAPSIAPLLGTRVVREQGGVRYLDIESRSLVGRASRRGYPFDWTANPFRGCAIGCRYCYAAYTHGFLGRDAASEFHSVVFVKKGWEAGTRNRLATAARRGDVVALGTGTDPYQPAEGTARVTRRFLELAAQVRGLRLTVTTKGPLVLRDVDLLDRIRARGSVSIAVSLISPRADLLRRIEPWAAPPRVRLEVMRRLVGERFDVGVAIAPILPALTDAEADLETLVAAVAAAGVRRLSWRLLFLRSPTREKYLDWLGREFPRHLADYRSAYAGGPHLDGSYPEAVGATMERLRHRYRLHERTFARRGPERPRQLELWD